MAKLRLSLACWDYDRTRAIADGRVAVDGIDLIYHALPVEETFFRMLRFREFDVAEMSLSSYCRSKFLDDPFVAIPVFPSRFFRQSCIFINERSGIREPKDLIGKRIGNPEYQMTGPTWIRGILAEKYGVPIDSVTYFTGGEEQPGRPEKLVLDLPGNIKVNPIGPQDTLSAMLADGRIEALYSTHVPSSYNKTLGIRRLFEDYVPVERCYYEDTKIFPIMHTVVIRRTLYEEHPWVAMALLKAFVAAKKIAYEDLTETSALKTMLPWGVAEYQRTVDLMDEDYWAYGLDKNFHVLDTFTRYSFEQGLSARKLDPKTLFVPETLEEFKV